MASAIIFILRDINHWAIKNVIRSIAESAKIHLLVYNISDELVDFCNLHKITFEVVYKKKWLLRLEHTLEAIVKIQNQVEHDRNRFISLNRGRKIKLKKKTGNHMIRIFPAWLMYFILARISSEYDKLIKSPYNLVIYISRFLPSLHLPLRFQHVGAKVYHWNYSWDHPFRSNLIPPTSDLYLVWNTALAEDLVEIHRISRNRIKVVGSAVVDYLVDKSLHSSGNIKEVIDFQNIKGKYLVYLFGTGYLPALEQEKELVRLISNILWNTRKDVVLIARPYPDSETGIDGYLDLENLPNVKVQKDIRIGSNMQTDEDMIVKRELLENSLGVINLYTTMAMEAAVLGKPVIQLAFIPESLSRLSTGDGIDVEFLMTGKHLTKYLYRSEFPNVVLNEDELRVIIRQVVNGDYNLNLLKYSDYLNSFCQPDKSKLSVEQIIDAIK
ncbi:hypothetical protein MASR1M107_28590 [Ignavibacteriales bacterium]